MKLKSVQITNFRSIDDSGEFTVKDVTCLVGKNESGKTAVLEALNKLKPSSGSKALNKDLDYPRKRLVQYEDDYGDSEAEVIRTTWSLDEIEVSILEQEFGENCLNSKEIVISKYYGSESTNWRIDFNEENIVNFLIGNANFDAVKKNQLKGCKTVSDISGKLNEIEDRTSKQEDLLDKISAYRDGDVCLALIDKISPHMPRFFYFSQYDMMDGKISVEQIREHEIDDSIFINFLKFAGTSLDDLAQTDQYETLRAKLEAASNTVTETIFDYWSQNKNLAVIVELREGRSGDEAPFNKGTVVEVRIKNNSHGVTLPFADRSTGFIWFFSFLVKFWALSKENKNMIILLDEPGLNLHSTAQADLLKYIEQKLKPKHQVIYTTHSPFMVPTNALASVRTVEDVEKDGKLLGTKVSEDSLSVTKDTLFPLQGALGYEITQALFIGENTLLVEGPSDILYLTAASKALKQSGQTHLDERWVICPAGGLDKVPAFLSLFSGNRLNVAVLTDIANGDRGKIERLKKTEILSESKILTYADFLGQNEADIEDMFGPELFSKILTTAYNLSGNNSLDAKKLLEANKGTCRLVKKAESYFNLLPDDVPTFDHLTPSKWLLENIEILTEDSQTVTDVLNGFESLFKRLNGFCKPYN